jgi:hypothetical protein
MTISAGESAPDREVFERSIELYRDLSVALRERITHLKTEAGGSAGAQCRRELILRHQAVLQSVLDLEAGLGTRVGRSGEASGGELDLDAARTEIRARLALWLAGR